MNVCHRAMQLFPERFPVTAKIPKRPDIIICELLEQFAASRTPVTGSPIFFEESAPFESSQIVNLEMLYGPGTAAKEEYESKILSDDAQKSVTDRLRDVYAWCNTLTRDPTTKTPICDFCGNVRPPGLADGFILDWMEFHYAHRHEGAALRCHEKYTDEDPAICDLAKGHIGPHTSGMFSWKRDAEDADKLMTDSLKSMGR